MIAKDTDLKKRFFCNHKTIIIDILKIFEPTMNFKKCNFMLLRQNY